MSEDFCPTCGRPDGAGHNSPECFEPPQMQDGVAYLLNLKRLLGRNDLIYPAGIILSGKMFDDIRRTYPALINGEDSCVFWGIKVYREKK